MLARIFESWTTVSMWCQEHLGESLVSPEEEAPSNLDPLKSLKYDQLG